MKLPQTVFGKRTDPADHPRWDGERIRPYDDPRDDVCWFDGTLADGLDDDEDQRVRS